MFLDDVFLTQKIPHTLRHFLCLEISVNGPKLVLIHGAPNKESVYIVVRKMTLYQRTFLVFTFLTCHGNAQVPKFDLRSFFEQSNQDLNGDDLEFRQIAENGILEYRTSDSDDKVLQLRNGLEIRTLETSEYRFPLE